MMEEPKLQVPQWDKREKSLPVSEEEQPTGSPIRTAACEVCCGLHLAAGVFMILFVNAVDQWPLLLLAILYCFLAGSFFGIMASTERYTAEIEGGE